MINLAATRPGEALVSVDLHQARELDIYATTVQEYEGLVEQIFPLLRLGAGTERPPASARRRGFGVTGV